MDRRATNERKKLTGFLLAVMIIFMCASACNAAEVTQDTIPRFEITRYRVEGSSILTAPEIDAMLQPFTGKQRDFGTVQEALERLEEAYRGRGFTTVRVTLPEQELEKGVVFFQVVETKLGKVKVEGNRFFDEVNIRGSLPALREGAVPNMNVLSGSLRVANESPMKKTVVQFQSGESEEIIDARVTLTDERPWKAGVTLDSTGNSQTGALRTGVLFQHGNLFNKDHLMTVQYITSPEKPAKVSMYSVGYRIPFYSTASSLELIGAYSDTDSGTLAVAGHDLNVSGKGTIVGLHYVQNLTRIGSYEHKLTLALDYRAFENGIDFKGTPLGNNVTVHPLSLTYTGDRLFEKGEASWYLTVAENLPGGIISRDDHSHFEKVRAGAPVMYTIWRYGVSGGYLLPGDWQLKALVNGQYTTDPLVPGEQFGVGGASSVRGFQEREAANDWGYAGSIEMYTPNLSGLAGVTKAQCRLLAFYDRGYAKRQDALPGETVSTRIASTGVGMRVMSGTNFFASTDLGWVVDPGGIRERWSSRWHIRLGALF